MTVHYILRMGAEMGLLLPFYLLLRKPWEHWNKSREWIMGVFFLFMISLLSLALEGDYTSPPAMLQSALTRLSTREEINLRPFYTISTFFHYCSLDVFLINIVGNVVLFVPWGIGLPLLWKRFQRPARLALWCFLLTAFIESVQLFICRHVDVDDLILNFSGGACGGMLYFFLRKRFPGMAALSEE